MSTKNEQELLGLIRDGLRYRELRKHRNRGYPESGIPFAMGWNTDEEGNPTTEAIYVREGELDSMVDDVLHNQDIFPGDVCDRLLEGLNETKI